MIRKSIFLSFALVLGSLLVPQPARAQLAPGCYNGMIGNGAAQGNVISSVSTATATSISVSSGCTPIITLGPILSAADISSIGTPAAAIATEYITALYSTNYNFSIGSTLSGYALAGMTFAGITATPTAFTAGQLIEGTASGAGAGPTVASVGPSFVVPPATASGTAGTSANLYFISNTATAGTVTAPYMYGSSNGAIYFKTQSPAGIYTNNAPIVTGSGYLQLANEHNYVACGTGGTGAAMAAGTAGAPVALGGYGPNCVGTLASGHAYYSFLASNMTNPCIVSANEQTGTNNGTLTNTLALNAGTWTVTFTSTNASDNNIFAFHLAACPN